MRRESPVWLYWPSAGVAGLVTPVGAATSAGAQHATSSGASLSKQLFELKVGERTIGAGGDDTGGGGRRVLSVDRGHEGRQKRQEDGGRGKNGHLERRKRRRRGHIDDDNDGSGARVGRQTKVRRKTQRCDAKKEGLRSAIVCPCDRGRRRRPARAGSLLTAEKRRRRDREGCAAAGRKPGARGRKRRRSGGCGRGGGRGDEKAGREKARSGALAGRAKTGDRPSK
jgi:hypothetical protein